MFQLNLKSGVPICDQIVNGIIRLKHLGVLAGGDQLPSVRSLAMKFSVNPNTVQKAYSILESKGIVYSVKGKGSFMSDDSLAYDVIREKATEDFKDSVKAALDMGLNTDELIKIINENF